MAFLSQLSFPAVYFQAGENVLDYQALKIKDY